MKYKIKDLAKILKIPESTARYFRDRHIEYMSSTGSGRKRRYDDDTLKALRLICDSENAEEAQDKLSRVFTRVIEVKDQNSNSNSRAVAEQQSFESVEVLARTLEQITIAVTKLTEIAEYNNLPWWQKIKNKKSMTGKNE